jgi:tetratricopeptide (TPR) repeat protein
MTNKIAISILLSAFIVLGLTARKKALVHQTAENASCRLILAPLPVIKPIDREIARQQALVVSSSSSANTLERLGWTFIRKARVSFDAGFYNLAEQCAACMEARGLNGPDALLLRAHALQSLHRFGDAETTARELVRLRERPFDYGVLGDILMDQGKVREGAAAYQKMVDLRPDLQSYARAAHVRWLTGDLDGAIQLIKLATAASSPNDPEPGAWVFTRLAVYQFQRNATKSALESCTAALALESDYAPAMLIRGRILLALNRAGDALIELQHAAELNPLPEYQWAVADALAATGARDTAEQIESKITENSEDPRTISLFLATRHKDVDRAVQLAQQELSNRGDVFTHDALAWALAAAGRTTEAQQHATQALSQGTADPRLFLHAGIIAALNNDKRQAKRLLAQASASKQTLLPSERAQLDAWLAKINFR